VEINMKLNKLSTLVASSVLLASASTTAMAEGAWETSANVALSTDYMWRGASQTGNETAISGGFDLGHESGFYAGIWASNVDFSATPSDASIEVDYYAGFAGDFGDSGFSYDIGGLFYDYPDADSADFFEVYGSVSYSFASAGIAYSSDVFGSDSDGTYFSLDLGHDVGMFSLAAGIGYYDFEDEAKAGVESYTNYYVGVSTELAGFGLDVTYHDIDEDSWEASTDSLVFTISKSM
jgi:uncharacterized protein (TIGR02001 family)